MILDAKDPIGFSKKVKIKINKRNLNKVKECLKLLIKLDFIHLGGVCFLAE